MTERPAQFFPSGKCSWWRRPGPQRTDGSRLALRSTCRQGEKKKKCGVNKFIAAAFDLRLPFVEVRFDRQRHNCDARGDLAMLGEFELLIAE